MKFSKVNFKIFFKDYCKANNVSAEQMQDDDFLIDIKDIYDSIKLPQRATKGSAGYDFFIPYTVDFHHKKEITIPTGIRFKCDDDKFLMCLPRSGLGFRHGMRLLNSAGIIDSDYFGADNEGHIMAKFTCEEPFTLEKGKAMMQGIILSYFTVDGDVADKERKGGFGSTGM